MQLRFIDRDKRLAASCFGPTLRVWEVATAKEVRRVIDGKTGVYGFALSPDGKTVATRGGEHTVRFWDFLSGKEKRPAGGHRMFVQDIAFASDGKTVATGAAAASVRLWDAATGRPLHRLAGHGNTAARLGFSADGKVLVSWGIDATLCRWSVATGKRLGRFKGVGSPYDMAVLSRDATTLATWGRQDRKIRLWETATGKELRGWKSPQQMVFSLAFAADGRTLASGGADGSVYVWDAADGRELRRLMVLGAMKKPYPTPVYNLAFSPDGRALAASYQALDPRNQEWAWLVKVWETATGGERLVIRPGASAAALVFSPDGRRLAFLPLPTNKAGTWGRVHLWDLEAGKELRRLGQPGGVRSVAFSPSGNLLATGGGDTTTVLWDLAKLVPAPRPEGKRLRARELKALWDDLAGASASRAYQAICGLAAAPRSGVAFLAGRLKQIVPANPARTARLVADLNSRRFAVRARAMRELKALGASAEPALRQALRGKPALEVRQRVESLLKKLALDGERVRTRRALEVLERAGTPQAGRVLKSLAAGPPGTWLTRQAQSCLDRLSRRTEPALARQLQFPSESRKEGLMVVMVQKPRLNTVDGRHFLHVPRGRGEELRLHLASHGINSHLSNPDYLQVERLDLEGDADPEVVQAILDQWEG
jgi:WD40 repeat protein